jgi:hypothetical protein
VAKLAADAAVRVVILTGSGRWFSAGGDVKAFQNGEFAAEVERGHDPQRWRIPEMLTPLAVELWQPCRRRGERTPAVATAAHGASDRPQQKLLGILIR